MWHSHAWWRDVSRLKWIALVLATAVVGGLSTLWAVGTKSEVEVTTANVNEKLCCGCQTCIAVCPYTAISFNSNCRSSLSSSTTARLKAGI